MNKLKQNTTQDTPYLKDGEVSKSLYIVPGVEVRMVELETGLAATSGYAKPNTPNIEDWGDDGSGTGDIVI